MSKVLSISVASYNAQDFLPKCLDSFLQVKNKEQLEVLIVDDGSKDNTNAIAQTYVNDHPEVFRLISKKNGGHGSTINAALKAATGKYFRVIDSDDWVDPGDMDQLLEILKDTDVDAVIGDYREVYPDSTRRVDVKHGHKTGIVYQFKDMETDYVFAMHSINIKRKLIVQLGRQIPEHCFYADTVFNYHAARCMETILFEPGCVYQYRLGREEQSVSAEGMYKHIEELMKIEETMINEYVNLDGDLHDEVKRKYLLNLCQTRWQMIFILFFQFTKSDKDVYLAKFYNHIKSTYPKIMTDLKIGWKQRPVFLNIQFMLPIMRVLWKLWHQSN